MPAFLTTPWSGILAILCWLFVLILGLHAYRRRQHPQPETLRKLFHLGGGAAALSLPWLFQDLWPVIVLGGVASSLFLLLRVVPGLNQGLGQILHGVERNTAGEFWFLTGVFLVFILAGGNKVLYCVPIAVQAIADTSAALVGVVYGRHRIKLFNGRKSAEGFIAFFLTAFLCIHVPILLWTNTGRLESLIIAVNMAFLLMLIEALSWKGLDNLLLPLFVFVMLKIFLQDSTLQLTTHLIVILCLSLFVYLWRRRTTLSNDSLIGTVLLGYYFWGIGGWHWLIAPITLFSSYTWLARSIRLDELRLFQIPVLLALVTPGLIWLTGYHMFDTTLFYYPFSVTFAANFGVIGSIRFKRTTTDTPFWPITLNNTAKGVLILLPSLLIVNGFTMDFLTGLLAGVPAIFAATALYNALGQKVEQHNLHTIHWSMVSLIVMASSCLTLTLLLLLPLEGR